MIHLRLFTYNIIAAVDAHGLGKGIIISYIATQVIY